MGTIKTLRLRWATHQQQWWGKWHLYLGIISGLIVAVVGVTGSILVFQDEIDRSLNPSLFIVLEKQRKIPLEEIIPMVKKNNPQLQFDYILNDDDKPNHAYYLYNFATEEQVFINPYTAEISGKRLYESGFIHWVTEIHRTILIPVAGRYIVGIASLILLILTITGLRLWIPQKWRQLKSVLSVKFSGSFKRQNYDWHNVLGFYSSPVIALLSLTGFCITFSFIIVPLLFILSGKSPQDVEGVLGAKSIYSNGAVQLPIEKIAAIGKEILPEDRIAGIAFPGDSIGNFRLDMAAPGLPKSGNREMLLIDQYSGKVLLNSRTDFPNVGNAYLSWLTPIHYGSFGGRPTQVIALIGGLIPLLLFITGFIIWWPRYKKQKRQKDKTIHFVKEKAVEENLPGVTASAPKEWAMAYFLRHFKKGFAYGLWCVAIAAAMGALYGVFSGIIIQPAVFSVVFTAILVVSNFIVALIVFLFNLLFLAPFKKASRPAVKYFALSLSLAIVFVAVYFLLVNTGLKIF